MLRPTLANALYMFLWLHEALSSQSLPPQTILTVGTDANFDAQNQWPDYDIDFRFIIVPIFVLVAAYAIPKWAREKVVFGVQATITFLGSMFLLVS